MCLLNPHSLQQTNEPLWRYLLSVTMTDHTANTWVSVFGEQGESIFGMTAPQYHESEAMDPEFYNKHALVRGMPC